MITLRVTHNATHVCTAGIGDLGVLTAIVTWVRRDSPTMHGFEEELTLEVGALHSPLSEHRSWLSPTIAAGDKIEIEILNDGQCDPPHKTWIMDKAERAEEEQDYVRTKAREWGWIITESPDGL